MVRIRKRSLLSIIATVALVGTNARYIKRTPITNCRETNVGFTPIIKRYNPTIIKRRR